MTVFNRRLSIASTRAITRLAVVVACLAAIPGSADDRMTMTMIVAPLQGSGQIHVAATLKEGEWNVVDASGNISVRQGKTGSWRPLDKNTTLTLSSQIKSGSNGWGLLSNTEATIAIAANTRMALPEKAESAGTRIIQSIGNMLFKVTKKPLRHFLVETPYLVAGVKGTTFGVSVSNNNASVSVSAGTVGVSNSRGGNESDVTAGQTASVGSAPGSGVDVQATTPGIGSPGQPGGPTSKNAPGTPGGGAPSSKGVGKSGGGGNAGGSGGGGNAGGSAGGNAGGNSGGGGNAGGSGGGNAGGSAGGNAGGNSGGGNAGGNAAGKGK